MRRKKVIHCGRCDSPATWYRKGKNHRVLLCGRCGVIASNPAPLAALAVPALSAAGSWAMGKMSKKGEEAGERQVIVTDSKDRPNYGERVVNQVMRSEGL